MKNSIAEFLMNNGVNASQFKDIEVNGQNVFNTSYDAFCTVIYRGGELVQCVVDNANDPEFMHEMVAMLFDMDKEKVHSCYMSNEEEKEIEEISIRVLGHNTEPNRGNILTSIGSTCKGCARVKTCVYAWDPYNTDGDCLADK